MTAYIYSAIIVVDQFIDVFPGQISEVYFDTAAVIIAFILLGKYMEDIVKKKSSAAVKKLLDLKPKTAIVIKNGNEIETPIEE